MKVQEEVGKVKKTEANPYFKSMYFDVNGLLAALKPTLSKLNLVIIQPLTSVDGHLGLETRLIDTETGEQISEKTILPDTGDAQKQGSAITYFRRYALQSFFALEAVDDDGNVASQQKVYPSKATAPEQYGYKKDGKHRDVGRDDAENDVL